VNVTTAKLLSRNLFPSSGFYERWPTEEYHPLVLNDYSLIAHRRNVCAPRGTGAQDNCDLRNTKSTHLRLIVEKPPEVVAIREDLLLER
jgi:hypothetical protein